MFWGIPEWALGVAIIILATGIGKAISARFTPPAPARERKGKDEGSIGEVQDLQRRLADVEERLDFAERLLSQQRDAQRLGSSNK